MKFDFEKLFSLLEPGEVVYLSVDQLNKLEPLLEKSVVPYEEMGPGHTRRVNLYKGHEVHGTSSNKSVNCVDECLSYSRQIVDHLAQVQAYNDFYNSPEGGAYSNAITSVKELERKVHELQNKFNEIDQDLKKAQFALESAKLTRDVLKEKFIPVDYPKSVE